MTNFLIVLSILFNFSKSDTLVTALVVTDGLSVSKAKVYSKYIIKYCRIHKIDPFLVSALIYRESRWRRSASYRKNYGLMQVRVSRTTNPKYLGKEHLLFNARLNIKIGVRSLKAWKRYHNKNCKGKQHYWWSHYQWGRVVKNNGSGRRVYSKSKEYGRFN